MWVVQIMIPIVLSIWIYLWFMKKQLSHYLGKTVEANKLYNFIFLSFHLGITYESYESLC